MKNSRRNQRPSNRGNTQRRTNANTSRNTQGRKNNNQSRNSGSGRKSNSTHLWASSSSSATLTSHLSMISKRNHQSGTNKNTTGKNGVGVSSGKPKGKPNYNSNGKNRNNDQGRPNKKNYNHQLHTARKNSSRSDSGSTYFKPTQQNKLDCKYRLESKTNTFGIDPFELFCAYHLGISNTNQYSPSNINEVANRFKLDTGITRQILKEYGMDSASLLDRDFDMAMAQLDIQVAPDGVDRTELARNIFEDFLEAPIKKRDWKKILEEDKKENAKTFGRR